MLIVVNKSGIYNRPTNCQNYSKVGDKMTHFVDLSWLVH